MVDEIIDKNVEIEGQSKEKNAAKMLQIGKVYVDDGGLTFDNIDFKNEDAISANKNKSLLSGINESQSREGNNSSILPNIENKSAMNNKNLQNEQMFNAMDRIPVDSQQFEELCPQDIEDDKDIDNDNFDDK